MSILQEFLLNGGNAAGFISVSVPVATVEWAIVAASKPQG